MELAVLLELVENGKVFGDLIADTTTPWIRITNWKMKTNLIIRRNKRF